MSLRLLLLLAAFLVLDSLSPARAEPPLATADKEPARDKAATTDRYGDPLPPGAVARCGTSRLRCGSEISCVVYSPDGKALATASQDARLWDSTTGRALRRFTGHKGSVDRVAFAPHGKVLATGGDQMIRLWDMSTGKEVRHFGTGLGGFYELLFSPDGKVLVSASGDRTVRFWDPASGKELRRLDEIPDAWLTFSPDGKTLAYGGTGGYVSLCDAATGKVVRHLRGHRGFVRALAFSADGKTLASGGTDRVVRLWDVAKGKERHCFQGHEDEVSALALDPGGKRLVSAGRDQTIRIWDLPSGKERHRIQQRRWVRRVALSPDGKTVASAGPFNSIRLWDTATGKERMPAEGHHGAVCSLAFLERGKKVVTGGADGSLRLWDVRSSRCVRRLLDDPHEIDGVAVSPNGRWIAAAGRYSSEVHVFDAETGKRVRELKDTHGSGLAFSPDSRRLACGGPEGAVEVREVGTGRRLQSFKGHRSGVHALAFSPDGTLLASSTLLDRTILFWDTARGKQARKITGRLGALYSLLFTPDGRWLVAQGRDNNISLWEVATGKEEPRFAGLHGYMVHALSPDSRMLAVAAFGGRARDVRLYEMATGKERCRFEGHLSGIRAVAFSPDNRTLATAGEDTTVLLWDLTRTASTGPPRQQPPDE